VRKKVKNLPITREKKFLKKSANHQRENAKKSANHLKEQVKKNKIRQSSKRKRLINPRIIWLVIHR